jgi:hypothetical protein
LENTLVDYTHSIGTGMKIKARPFLFKFLDELSATYEIIVFSNVNESTVFYI